MLSQLSISQIAVIEKASISFENGFTVLTGETGAGKSIIIDAIHAVLGERTNKDLVRTGADSAWVSALFTDLREGVLRQVEDLGFPVEEDGSLLIQRTIRSSGKSLCKVNGMAANVSTLKKLGISLIRIHGQHESYELLSETAHMDYIDSFGLLKKDVSAYQKCFQDLKSVQKQLSVLQMDEDEKTRQMDLLGFQIEELESAHLRQGEQERLTKERDQIRNRERIAAALGRSRDCLMGDDQSEGVLSTLSDMTKSLESVVEFLPRLKEPLQTIQDAAYLLEDAELSLRGMDMDYDPQTLGEIEDRLDQIYRLSLKYGQTEEKMLAYLAQCQEKLGKIETADEEKRRLLDRYESLKDQCITLAKALSAKRRSCAKKFETLVKGELAGLNMPGIAFVVEVQRVPLYQLGCDRLQFLISVNKGETPKPMSKIASGGELSRIMLAIKAVLSDHDEIDTMIFDEVDTGISGEAAKKVGERLRRVSRNRQTICITHLPQIAAMADQQILIHKHTQNEKTYTEVQPIEGELRVGELARMITGYNPTEIELDMARSLLKKNAGEMFRS